MPDAVLLAPLAVGGALVVAGVAKVRGGVALREAFDGLGVPALLAGSWVVVALPWVEIVLGLALLLPGVGFVVTAVLVTVLLVVYAGLVLRAVVGGREVDCDCFGGWGDGRVGPRTVVRNLLLLACAVVSVVDGVAGRSLVGRLAGLDVAGRAWVVATALVVVLLVLSVRGSAQAVVAERRGIPYLVVQTDDGRDVSLPELASHRPQLLVTLSSTCSGCARVSERIASWPAQLPELDVRVLVATPPGGSVPATWPGVLHDPQEQVAAVLGLVRPSAVLLGADALVAGGPVHGAGAVLAFVEEIRESLAATGG